MAEYVVCSLRFFLDLIDDANLNDIDLRPDNEVSETWAVTPDRFPGSS